jgi:hypothetical protein
MKLQGRFRHLKDDDIAYIQQHVTRKYNELRELAAADAEVAA